MRYLSWEQFVCFVPIDERPCEHAKLVKGSEQGEVEVEEEGVVGRKKVFFAPFSPQPFSQRVFWLVENDLSTADIVHTANNPLFRLQRNERDCQSDCQ